MTKERVEDLGKLAVLIEQLTDHELFDRFALYSKHYTIEEDLAKMVEEKRSDVLWEIQCQIKYIQEKLYECLAIAQGTDPLNEGPE